MAAKGIYIGWEGRNKTDFAPNHMIMDVENPKEMTKQNKTKKLLELISYYVKVSRYKVNVQKSIALLFTSSKQLECEI